MQQSISCYVSLALAISNLKVVLEKLLYLMDMPRAQTFGIYKPVEIVMIAKDKYLK